MQELAIREIPIIPSMCCNSQIHREHAGRQQAAGSRSNLLGREGDADDPLIDPCSRNLSLVSLAVNLVQALLNSGVGTVGI